MEYKEDEDPLPYMVFERDPRTREFRPNKVKSVLPRSAINFLPDEYQRCSQKDRDEYIKNLAFHDSLEKLIRQLQKRDTKGNIARLQEEFDQLSSQ